LAVSEDQLDYKVIYAIGRDGKTFEKMPESDDDKADTSSLFEAILDQVPSSIRNKDEPFTMMVSSFEKNKYLGKLAVGRVNSGEIRKGERVKLIDVNGEEAGKFEIERLYVNEGLEKVETEEAGSGEIVYLAGIDQIKIGQTIADVSVLKPLASINISEPTIKVSFGANTGQFASKEAKFLTSRQLIERLKEEIEIDLGLKLEEDKNDPSRVVVAGRGELHLAILIERLRRQDYAMEVSKPEVILKEINGVICEPWEEMTILVNKDFVGVVSGEVGKRRGQLLEMTEKVGEVKMVYKISEENALGLRSVLMTKTKGQALISFIFLGFELRSEILESVRNGAMVASETGKALPYGLSLAQKRGVTFVEPREEVYEGQIVGLRPVGGDLEINVCKGKQLTNMRSVSSDEAVTLSPAIKYSLEEALDFIESDELLDITPKALRLRKKLLSKLERVRAERRVRSGG